jgi:hypothetical protein
MFTPQNKMTEEEYLSIYEQQRRQEEDFERISIYQI